MKVKRKFISRAEMIISIFCYKQANCSVVVFIQWTLAVVNYTFKNDQKVHRLEARGAKSDTIRSFWCLFRHFHDHDTYVLFIQKQNVCVEE